MPYQVRSFPAYPTHIHFANAHDVDSAALTRIIYALRDSGHMLRAEGSPGDQTFGEFSAIQHPAVQKLVHAFLEMVAYACQGPIHVVGIRSWANISRPNDPRVSSHPHVHHPYHWSGVFYPQVPKFKAPNQGQLIFMDARRFFGRYEEPPIGLTPETGTLVVFPSWVEHNVAAFYDTDLERLSISLNALLGPAPGGVFTLPPHRVRIRPGGVHANPADQEPDPDAPAGYPYP
jgi:hypothetical protein